MPTIAEGVCVRSRENAPHAHVHVCSKSFFYRSGGEELDVDLHVDHASTSTQFLLLADGLYVGKDF